MTDPDFSLSWPRELFIWEARRILNLFGGLNWPEKVEHLVAEGVEDPAAAEYVKANFGTESWLRSTPRPEEPLNAWLEQFIANPDILREYSPPAYWAERHGTLDASVGDTPSPSLAEEWSVLAQDFASTGYFPRILPVECADAYFGPDAPDVSAAIFKATRLRISWPFDEVSTASMPESTLFTLIEYFHDQAQRPLRTWFHEQNECGFHYEDFNRESGGAIYRWKVNALLEAHRVPYRLGAASPERGRLIRSFGVEVDSVLNEQITAHQESSTDEVSNAIQMFRSRSANVTQKRAAINLLARNLEPRREAIGRLISRKSESDLFLIANRFDIRHNNGNQQSDYGEEFLDWMFLNHLAAVRLMDALKIRDTVESN